MGTQTFTATGSWQAPSGVTSVDVECWGGGGSGGAGTGNPSTGGGGAGGCYVKKLNIAVTPGNTYTVTVGAGGVATTTLGVAGGDSWFSTTGTVLAKGGAGGSTGATNNSNGAGATGSSTGCVGDVGSIFAGGNGGTGVVATPISGGGGGGAGTGGAGGNASVGTAGTGTATGGGNGGAGVAVANTRNAGSAAGGGGSGGYASGAADRSGGDGGRGEVILNWTDPPVPFFPLTNQPLEVAGKKFKAMPFFAYQAVMASPAQTFVSGQSVDPLTVLSFQYDGLMAPPHIPSIPPETLTLDKWAYQFPRPVPRARRLVSYGVNTAVAKEVVPTMEWAEQPALPNRSRQGLKDYAFNSFTTGGAPPTTPAVFVSDQSVDPVIIKSFQYESLSLPLPQITAAESLTLDKWFSPERVQRWQVRQQDLSIRVAPFVLPSLLPPMTWYQPTPVPRRTLAQLQYLYPYLAIDAAFWLAPSTPVDYLSPNKHIASAILFTSHVGVGVLTVSNTGASTITVSGVGVSTITTQNVGTEP